MTFLYLDEQQRRQCCRWRETTWGFIRGGAGRIVMATLPTPIKTTPTRNEGLLKGVPQ